MIIFAVLLAGAIIALLATPIKLVADTPQKNTLRLRFHILGVVFWRLTLYFRFKNGVEVWRIGRKVCIKTVKREGKSSSQEKIVGLLSKSNVKKFELMLKLGVGDAAADALICGTLRVIVSSVLTVLGFKNFVLRVIPDFNNTSFEVNLSCIITMRLANIIRILLKERR